MVRRGDRISNAVSGEQITFLQTSDDTNGELVQMEVSVAPGGKEGVGAPIHLHPKQEERFLIKSGWMKVIVKGEEKYYGPGEHFTIAPGVPHKWSNARRNEKLDFIRELRPGMEAEKIYETVGALSHLGELKEDGSLSVMQLSVIQSKYPDVIALPDSPVFLQKVFFKIISSIARVVGYKPYLDYNTVLKKQEKES